VERESYNYCLDDDVSDSHGSVSVFNVGIDIRFGRYFFKSVRYSVSVFQDIVIFGSVGILAGPLRL